MDNNDNPYSVDKEYKEILADGKANKNYFVLLSDADELKLRKNERIVHKTRVVSTSQINDLRQRLLNLEMQDGGTKIQFPKRKAVYVIYLYIISRN